MVKEWIQQRAIVAYVGLAYGITWSIAIIIALSYHGIIALDVPLSLHYILPFGPLLSALVVSWAIGGSGSLREIIGRMTKWRVKSAWIAVAVLSVWIMFLLSSLILLLTGASVECVGAGLQ